MNAAQVLIDGRWRAADAEGTFHAENPAKGEALPLAFPISRWSDCDAALNAATKAAAELRALDPAKIAAFLDAYAANIEAAADSIVAAAAEETALPVSPRLKDVELPRTTNQLRQAAAAVREESWRNATLDLEKNIRSCFAPIGPVVIFGPNNFPFAFNGVSGGDFAAAIAAGNPVIAKAHPLHPNTTEQAFKAVESTGLPPATVQMIYNINNENGLKLVSDPRVGAVGFTGSRNAGLHLKRAAEDAGKPIFLEMSSINPVIFLPGALAERHEQLAQELVDSVLAGSGQFCTSPNLLLVFETPQNQSQAEVFLAKIATSFTERPAQPLLSSAGRQQLQRGVTALTNAGAQLVTGGNNAPGEGYRYANTLLRATAAQFLAAPHDLQREIFGNATLAVVVNTQKELESILGLLEGNLTGTVYSAKSGAAQSGDDAIYNVIAPLLRERVGRLLNDKMPTGVAVSPAMNHGGPYPATSHPGTTSVGIPASIHRFAKLECYDAVRPERLPAILKDTIANPGTWRLINGNWTKG